jgi:hypothetical protein
MSDIYENFLELDKGQWSQVQTQNQIKDALRILGWRYGRKSRVDDPHRTRAWIAPQADGHEKSLETEDDDLPF